MSDATVPATLDDIDLTDHDAFVERVPHEWFTLLRHEDPVHWQEERDGPGFWCVTRYQDVRAVHRNPAVFSSELGGTSLEDLEAGGHRGAEVDDRHGPAAPRRAARAAQPPLHPAGDRRVGGARAHGHARGPRRGPAGRRAGLRRGDQRGDPDDGLRAHPRRAGRGSPPHHRARRQAAGQVRSGVRRSGAGRRAPPPAVLEPARRSSSSSTGARSPRRGARRRPTTS